MPAPLAPIVYAGGMAVARYVAKHGIKKAAQKYGQAAVKRINKRNATSAAARAAAVSGEGAAVRAVNNRRNSGTTRKQRRDEFKKAKKAANRKPADPLKETVVKSVDTALNRAAKGKVANDFREARLKKRRAAAAKKAQKATRAKAPKRNR